MFENGLSAGDIMALTKDNEGFLEGNGIIVLILFLLMFFMNGNGFGNNNRGNCATQQDVTSGFQFNQVDNGIRGLERGICDLGYASLNQTNQLGAQIAQSAFQAKECCCETNRNIDALRYEGQKNTCDITTAIHAEAEQTRQLITANVMQELRDQNTAYQLQLSNQAQTANLISQLRPFPVPAYITCSPYQASNVGYGYNGYGYNGYNGCGSCGGCGCNV